LFLTEFCDFVLSEIDCLRDLDTSRANTRAFEAALAGPDSIGIVQLGQAFLETVIPAVVVEAGRLDDCCWAEKVGVNLLDDGTGGIAGYAEDAFCALLEQFPVLC